MTPNFLSAWLLVQICLHSITTGVLISRQFSACSRDGAWWMLWPTIGPLRKSGRRARRRKDLSSRSSFRRLRRVTIGSCSALLFAIQRSLEQSVIHESTRRKLFSSQQRCKLRRSSVAQLRPDCVTGERTVGSRIPSGFRIGVDVATRKDISVQLGTG